MRPAFPLCSLYFHHNHLRTMLLLSPPSPNAICTAGARTPSPGQAPHLPVHSTSAALPSLVDLQQYFQLLPSSCFHRNTMSFLTCYLPISFDLKIREQAAHTVNDME